MDENFEKDAVFLPGKIHGNENEIWIIYMNWDSTVESWEIMIVDAPRIIELYEECAGNAEAFWGTLPDLFHGEWYYYSADKRLSKKRFLVTDNAATLANSLNEPQASLKYIIWDNATDAACVGEDGLPLAFATKEDAWEQIPAIETKAFSEAKAQIATEKAVAQSSGLFYRDRQEEFLWYREMYSQADFVCGREGDSYDEMNFIAKWAYSREDLPFKPFERKEENHE